LQADLRADLRIVGEDVGEIRQIVRADLPCAVTLIQSGELQLLVEIGRARVEVRKRELFAALEGIVRGVPGLAPRRAWPRSRRWDRLPSAR